MKENGAKEIALGAQIAVLVFIVIVDDYCVTMTKIYAETVVVVVRHVVCVFAVVT